MAVRTIQTGDDVEAAVAFLCKQSGKDSESFFMDEIAKVFQKHLDEADTLRFEMAKKLFAEEKDKGVAVSKLRELLGA